MKEFDTPMKLITNNIHASKWFKTITLILVWYRVTLKKNRKAETMNRTDKVDKWCKPRHGKRLRFKTTMSENMIQWEANFTFNCFIKCL